MKIQLVSDIHLEFYPEEKFPKVENQGADVLILAGDICTASKCGRFIPWFEELGRKFEDIYYVIGNHEHYNYKYDQTSLALSHKLNYINNLHVLDNSYDRKNGVWFWGGTLWTDCNKGDQDTRQTLARGMNDFRVIQYGEWDHMLPVNAEDEHRKYLQGLTEFLEPRKNETVVVVTHHGPSPGSIHPSFSNSRQMNGGFVSDLDEFIKKHPEISLWVHGHVHNSFDYTVGNTRIVTNPMGYPVYRGGTENKEFKPDLILET